MTNGESQTMDSRPTGLSPQWVRQSRIIRPPESHEWWRSHAQTPTPLVINDRCWRIFFGARDSHNRSRIIFVDVDPLEGMRCLRWHTEPVLQLGEPGTFDSAGQAASSILRVGSDVYMFYVGMHLRRDVAYGMAAGLAVSMDGGTSFERVSAGPVLAQGPHAPFFVSMPFVEHGAKGYSAWYMNGLPWASSGGSSLDPWYDLKCASSPDGLRWEPTIGGGLGLADGEAGMARPWLVRCGPKSTLVYSSRGAHRFRDEGGQAAYRLISIDLDENDCPTGARRPIQFSNPPAAGDWDSWMQAYACVLPYRDGWALLYSGDGFGQAGIGWATLQATPS